MSNYSFLENSSFELDKLKESNNIPGIGIGISYRNNDQISISGIVKIGENKLLKKESPFHMGSCGKAVTALLIHKLRDEGTWNLDDPLQVLIDIPLHQDYQKITINDLLTHSAGLPSNFKNPIDKKQVAKDLLTPILSQSAINRPKSFSYSNISYILLGLIAAEKKKSSYEELMQSYIFDPLGMKETNFTGKNEKDAPWGHYKENGILLSTKEDNPPVYHAAGGIYASLGDWLKFLKYSLDYQNRNEIPYFVYSQDKIKYTAYGFLDDGIALSHHGTNTLHHACVRVNLKENLAIIVTANEGGDEAEDMIADLADETYNNFYSRFTKL